MKKTFALLAASVVVGGCLLVSLEGDSVNKVVYLEEFDHYAYHVDGFKPGTKCVEWATGSLKGLGFAPEAEGLAREGFFPIVESPKGKWTLTFLAWKQQKAPSPFSLVLYYGDRQSPKTVEHPFVASNEWWQTCAVFSENNDTLVGWNLKGGTNTNVFIDRVRVEQGVHRPYRLGDPTEWIAAAKPVVDEKLPEDFGVALEPKKPVAVDLEKEDLLFKYKPTGRDELVFGCGGAGAHTLQFGLGDDIFQSYQTLDGKPLVLKNEYVTIRPTRMDRFPKIYSRPCVFLRYQKPEMAQVLAAREKFPAPTNRVFDVRVTRNERGENELYVDGNFALFFTNAPVVAVSGTPSFRMKTAPRPADSLVRKLDFRQWPDGFPLWNVRENRGGCWIGILDYCCRSAFEASPSSCLFSVPNRPYVRARALCRVATDVPVDFEPVVVARLTSYYKKSHGDAGGRSADACAKAEVRLPRPGSNGPLPKGVVKKGENLYEVTFDLDIGQMQDLLYRGDAQMDGVSRPDQLDLEFTGILWRQDTAYVDRSSVPDCDAQSSVVVLSGELEAAPCDFDVVPFHPYSVYFPEETAGGRYMIRPRQPGRYAIAWTVTDETGKVVDRGAVEKRWREKVEVENGVINFKVHDVGYYKVRYSFMKDGTELWHHDAAFVVVPTDDRQAGYESPYAAWLWCGIHGTNPDLEGEMEVFKRLGIRKTMLTEYARRAETNDLCRAYKLGLGEFPWRGFQVRKGETFDQAVERQAKANRKLVAEYPHCKRALIFHESGNGPFPMELVGGKTELTEKDREKDLQNVERARGAALAWRKADPSVKLVMGNSVESYGLLAGLFRNGFPKDLVDYVGEESVGYSTTPEESSARVPWIQCEIARLYGYEAKSECPFEWKCRAPRLFEDPGYLLTAFHLRDLLISHALGYTFIAAGGTKSGTSDGYVQSCWSSRADERWPLAYPARDTVATAVLTSILDCGKFKRLVPTGSLGVYCEEFEVKGKYVYALWTTRGEVEMTIDFGKDAHFTEMRPREKDVGAVPRNAPGECVLVSATGKRNTITLNSKPSTLNSLPVSDEPQYLVCAKPVAGAKAALQRRYPREEIAFANRAVAVPLVSADEVVVSGQPERKFFWEGDKFLRRGPFAAKTANDPVKGACVELKDLSGTEKTPKAVANCTVLRFPKAQPVPGEFDSIGVWVEGNMNGGKIQFEITDAEGEVWATTGSAGYGVPSYDWPDAMSVNFDGWHFLKFPLTRLSPVKNATCGRDFFQVTRDGNGNGKIDFPVKVTALAVGNRPWNLDFLEMRPTRPFIRLKDVTLLKGAAR